MVQWVTSGLKMRSGSAPGPEERLPMFTPAEAEQRYARLLAWALGIPEDAELPPFGDLLQQVRGVRNT